MEARKSEVVKIIKNLCKKHKEKVIAIRRHLHMNPELSFEEHNTSLYIETILQEHNVVYTKGWAGTGLIAQVGSKKHGHKVIALRADLDALPIQEENDVTYISKNKGIMHACGHDVHSSCLLGAILILNELKEQIPGLIKFIFQPGEEKLPGGASMIIKEGGLKNPAVNSIYGQHVHPPLEVGKIGVKAGPYMASADEIYLTIIGKGGHGALPNNCVDPIVISSHVIIALQDIISRKSDPLIPSVLTIGKINSMGGATNIIPQEVKLEGTFRTMDEKWRTSAHELIDKTVSGICHTFGATCEINIMKGYPSLNNDIRLTLDAKSKMIEYMGAENVVDLPLRMTAEDFSYYSHEIPACFYRLGTGNKTKGITSPVHTPTFDIDEDSLEIGMGMMAYLAMSNFKE